MLTFTCGIEIGRVPRRRFARQRSDILQVWLDVAGHPARGAAQAGEIRRRALAAIFKEKS